MFMRPALGLKIIILYPKCFWKDKQFFVINLAKVDSETQTPYGVFEHRSSTIEHNRTVKVSPALKVKCISELEKFFFLMTIT